MARVAVFLDHDIMIRHFILSGALRPLERDHEVFYVVPDAQKRVTVDISGHVGRVRRIPIDPERSYRWRRLYHAHVLARARTSSDGPHIEAFWREQLGRRAYVRSALASRWPLLPIYRALVGARNGRNVVLEGLLQEERVDAVVHPTVLEGPFVTDLIDWGRAAAKPVILLMNSWDNPSLKATVHRPDAWLVVWGEQTRRQAVSHLGWDPAYVRCLGAAQFDVYRRPPLRSRASFLADVGLSPDVTTLLYAGSSKGLNEVRHLLQIERAIEDGRLPRCQIVFRPHPWRTPNPDEPDFDSIGWRWVRMDPQMVDFYRSVRRSGHRIFLPDYDHTHTLLSSVDAVVSPLSTILLEAAMHGVPVLTYLPEEETRDNQHARTILQVAFMQEFFDVVGAPCTDPDAFVPACRALLASAADPGTPERMRAMTRFFVADTGRPYGVEVSDLVGQVTGERR